MNRSVNQTCWLIPLLEGTDPVLKDTYVMFGVRHLDQQLATARLGNGRGAGKNTDAATGAPDAQGRRVALEMEKTGKRPNGPLRRVERAARSAGSGSSR